MGGYVGVMGSWVMNKKVEMTSHHLLCFGELSQEIWWDAWCGPGQISWWLAWASNRVVMIMTKLSLILWKTFIVIMEKKMCSSVVIVMIMVKRKVTMMKWHHIDLGGACSSCSRVDVLTNDHGQDEIVIDEEITLKAPSPWPPFQSPPAGRASSSAAQQGWQVSSSGQGECERSWNLKTLRGKHFDSSPHEELLAVPWSHCPGFQPGEGFGKYLGFQIFCKSRKS